MLALISYGFGCKSLCFCFMLSVRLELHLSSNFVSFVWVVWYLYKQFCGCEWEVTDSIQTQCSLIKSGIVSKVVVRIRFFLLKIVLFLHSGHKLRCWLGINFNFY